MFFNGSNTPVIKDKVTITATAVNGEYNGSAHAGYKDVNAGDYNTSALVVTYAGRDGTTYADSPTAPTNAGKYTVTIAVPSTDNNYTGSVSVDFEITPREIGITWSNTELTFNGQEQAPTATATDLIGEDACIITVTGGQTNAGTGYTATATAVNNANYKLPADGVTTTFVIKTVEITDVTLAANSAEVSDSAQTPEIASVKAGELVLTASDYTVSYKDSDGNPITEMKNVGTYTVVVTAKNDSNFSGSKEVEWKITKAKPTITTVPTVAAITYGQTLEDATLTGGAASVDGTFAFKDTTTVPTVADSGVTEYEVIFTPSDTTNYDPVTIKVTVTVNPKEIGITWGDTAFIYDGESKLPTASVTENTEANGYQLGLTVDLVETTEGAGTNVGTYTAKVTGITGDKAGNYKLPTAVTKTFEIKNASQTAPTVTGVNETVANKADGKITGVNSDMEYRKDGESTYTAITGTEVTGLATGTYYVRYAAKDNYDASPNTTVEIGTGIKLTVTIPAEQTGYTLTANTTEVNYGGSVTLTYSLADGYTAGENFAVTATNCTVTKNENGTYTLSNITDNVVVSVTGVQDVTVPTANINITTNNWNTFLNTITFGKYFNATQTVTITASDAGSGMSKIYYYLASQAMTLEQVQDITDWTEYSEAFSIDPDNQYAIYAKAVDNDGNTVWISSEGIVLDKTTPNITGVTNNGVYYTTQKVTATDNTTLDTLTLNGTTFDGTIPGNPAQETKHTIVATDKAGNSTTVTVTMKPIRVLAEATNDLTNDNVTSANTPALEALVEKLDELLADDDVTDGERETLEQHKAIAESLIQTIEDTAAEQKAVTDKAAEFDEDAVKSTDKAELEKLAEDIDALLDTNNLTQDERTALETLLEQVEGMTDTIDKTAADSKTATDAIDALAPETVKSTDKAAVEAALETIENLLDGDHLTEDERKALDDAKADAKALLDAIEEAAKTANTENTYKVEDVTADNVTPEDKSDLEDAKADLEKALEDNSGNYTEEEKKAIEDEIARIDEALQVVENVEAVEDAISDLPATVEPDDEETVAKIEDAAKAYDELTEYEKSLVDEDTKKKLDDLTAAAVAYKIVKGDGSKWTKGGTSGLSFTANGPLGKFSGVEIDGKVIDTKYYDAVAGSTVITLKTSYLETLSTGKHTITVVYTDGEAEGTFKINAKSVTPATGDDSNIMLWAGILCVSMLGLVVLLADRKRRRSTK